jgi:hypothetical protein
LVGKLEGKRWIWRPLRRWEDNIRTDLRELGWEGVDWMHLAQDRDQWRAVVNTMMNLRFPWNSWLAKWIFSSQEWLCPMKLVSQSVSQSVTSFPSFSSAFLICVITKHWKSKLVNKSPDPTTSEPEYVWSN